MTIGNLKKGVFRNQVEGGGGASAPKDPHLNLKFLFRHKDKQMLQLLQKNFKISKERQLAILICDVYLNRYSTDLRYIFGHLVFILLHLLFIIYSVLGQTFIH